MMKVVLHGKRNLVLYGDSLKRSFQKRKSQDLTWMEHSSKQKVVKNLPEITLIGYFDMIVLFPNYKS